MRVLAIVQTWNGADPIRGFIVPWMEKLAARLDELLVLTLEQRQPATQATIHLYSLGKERSQRRGQRWRYLAQWHRHMHEILRRRPPDVVFTHMSPIFSVLAAPYAKAHGIPIITWYAHPRLTWTLRLAHHLSDRVVTSLATAYPYRRDKLTVVGQGIDTDLFAPDVHCQPAAPPLILYVGRLSPVKDLPTLLQAAHHLHQRWHQPFQVVILGGPASPRDQSHIQSLRAQVKQLGLEGTVAFEPPLPMTELPSWYRRCTVLVNLTPMGSGDKVAWEAMASGRPCLVANEGFRETLGEYAAPLLFRRGDAQDLAAKLQALLDLHAAARDQLGAYLRAQVLCMHSLDRLSGQLTNVFRETCVHRGSSL
jgi:glycosyltransferase involved in cell wall biosynthesis